MFMKTSAAVLATALLFAGTVNAGAAAVSYTDFASWNAAVPGFTSLAIPDPIPAPDDAAGTQYFGTGDASVSYGGVTFSSSALLGNRNFYNIGPTFAGSNGLLPVLSSQGADGLANILITLIAPVKAFALNFDTFFGSDVTFTLSNGETFTLAGGTNAYDLTGFFGVVDGNPFNTILLTSSDTALNINELKLGAAVVAPIPEPATWVMLVLGFLGIGLFGAQRSVRRVASA